MANLASMHIVKSEKKLVNDHSTVLLIQFFSLFNLSLDFATFVEWDYQV